MVVVGVVLVVVVEGPLVVVVWVVVGLVLRVWPIDPLWVFRSPLWGWGVGHRGQSPGLHYVVGMGEGLGAGLDGDGGRGVPRPWVGLAGGGGGLWGMDDGAGVVPGGFVSLRLRCCVCSRGRRLGFGVGFGVGVRFGFGVGFGVGVRFQVEEYLCRVRGRPGGLPGCLSRLCGGWGVGACGRGFGFHRGLEDEFGGKGGVGG